MEVVQRDQSGVAHTLIQEAVEKLIRNASCSSEPARRQEPFWPGSIRIRNYLSGSSSGSNISDFFDRILQGIIFVESGNICHRKS